MKAEFKEVRKWCCEDGKRGPAADCGSPSKLEGMAAKHVMEFAVNEKKWIAEFQKAWKKVTEKNMEGKGKGKGRVA